jgi:hypothetical protein
MRTLDDTFTPMRLRITGQLQDAAVREPMRVDDRRSSPHPAQLEALALRDTRTRWTAAGMPVAE